MADYKNCICIACRNEFEPDDDIVVCPECGTPYHRDCWNAHGHCINTELHEKGEAWTPPVPPEEKNKAVNRKTCPQCGAENDESNLFCTQCGSSMRAKTQDSAFMGESADSQSGWRQYIPGMMSMQPEGNPEEDMEGIRLQDAVDFVGKNTAYYIPRFRYFRDQKRKLAPNFVCLLFPELYFAYRKMWLLTILTIVVTFLLSIPGMLISVAYQMEEIIAMMQTRMGGLGSAAYAAIEAQFTSFAETLQPYSDLLYNMDLVCSYLTMAMHILLFLFGNYLYYRHALKKIRTVRADQKSLMDVQSRIRMAGGAHFGFVVLAAIAEFTLTALFTYLLLFL